MTRTPTENDQVCEHCEDTFDGVVAKYCPSCAQESAEKYFPRKGVEGI